MAKTHEIKVETRNVEGKGASRRLRRAGSVPAIVYGGELAPVSIQISHNDVWHASQNEWFYASILDLNLAGRCVVGDQLTRSAEQCPSRIAIKDATASFPFPILGIDSDYADLGIMPTLA